MFDFTAALISLAAGAAIMTVVWAVHLSDRDASIVDPVWGPAVWVIALVYALAAGGVGSAGLLCLVMSGAWAVRLSWHLGRRHAGEGEDRRYRKMREKRGKDWWWQSLYAVFLLQAALAWVVALPLAAVAQRGDGFGPLGVLGLLVFLFGFFYEAIADGQLAHFRASPESRGKVFDGGLWKFSRHPNYFGEFTLWWGLFLVAAETGAWWTGLGPLLLSVLLLKVSGVTMTEEDIAERRPDYADYVRRTNAFFPSQPQPEAPGP